MFIAFFTFYYYLLLCNMAKKEVVQDIFNDIAPKYDLLNHLLSMNIDKGWRRKKVGDLHLADAIELKTGDCEHMEFATGMFDVVTVAFGVRNFEHLELGLQEMYRVLKTGGKVIILEFSMPEHFPMKQLYRFYFCHILPTIGGWISGNKGAYTYLPESVMKFPQGETFLQIMRDCGFQHPVRRKLSFGIASLYVGEK